MSDHTDPFRHHPELRGLLKDPAQSFFRTFQPSDVDEVMLARGREAGWRYTDAFRNQLRDEFLASLPRADLWVFGYGSLIWDLGANFTEIRKAYAPGYARRFILYDDGARGTADNPAVMAALDKGDGCEGVVFRLSAHTLKAELDYIWRREMIAPAYNAVMIDVTTELGKESALTFTANHSDENIRPDLTFDQQVEALATASGIIGDNFEYIDNLKRNFDALGIVDQHVNRLYEAAKARRETATAR